MKDSRLKKQEAEKADTEKISSGMYLVRLHKPV